jgi:hypothetical protein
MSQTAPAPRNPPLRLLLLGVLAFAFGVYAYATSRYAGHWVDSDTSMVTRAIQSVNDDQTILEPSDLYSNGFTYQAVSTFIVQLSGVSVQQLQRLIYPLGTGLLALVVFAAYRALLGSSTTALLGTLILFMQPDFLFVTWRGSHERFTWALALALLYLLAKSVRKEGVIPYSILYYFTAFAFVSCNAFFASSYIAGLAFSFTAGAAIFALRRALKRGNSHDAHFRRYLQRLMYVTLATGVLLYLFFVHIYPPAVHLLYAFDSLMERVAALLLNYDRQIAANPYDFVTSTWIDARIYLVLVGLSLIIAALSFIVWLPGMFRLVFHRHLDIRSGTNLLVWLLYPVFALQIVLALGADQAEAGGNLQLRLFTPLMIVAVPLVALGLRVIWERWNRRLYRALLTLLLALVALLFSTASLLKFTNEPVLSNNWIFTLETERRAAEWAVNATIDTPVWTGPDWRITLYIIMNYPRLPSFRTHYNEIPVRTAALFVVSAFEDIRWKRRGHALPSLVDHLLVYDNGTVKVYQKRTGVAVDARTASPEGAP